MLHNHITNFIACMLSLRKRFFKRFPRNIWNVKLYIPNGAPVLTNESWCEEFRYIPYDDACIVMSQILIKIIILLLKLFKPHHLNYFFIKIETLAGPSCGLRLLFKR